MLLHRQADDGREHVRPDTGLCAARRADARDNTVMTSPQRFTHIARPEGVAPGPGYTQVVTGTGRLVAVSGQIALDPNGQLVGPGDPSAQARQLFENLRRCLAAAGLSFGEMVKLTFYLTDMAHLPAVRQVRDEFIDTTHPPASTAVQVVALARPEFLLEVEAFGLAQDTR
jgi:enamine deaminase RidA (YjgF/YER057c/UK114 family)